METDELQPCHLQNTNQTSLHSSFRPGQYLDKEGGEGVQGLAGEREQLHQAGL